MHLEWSRSALNDLRHIATSSDSSGGTTGAQLARTVTDHGELLIDHPRIGRQGRLEETRELVVPTTPYIVIYRLQEETVTILRVLHHARQWPPRRGG